MNAWRAGPVGLLADRPFRRYWSGQTISVFGDEVSKIGLPLTGVLAMRANPAQMGYLMAAWLAPSLLLSLPAGILVDRYGHRRYIMIAADLGRAAVMASVPVAFAAGALGITQLYAVAFGVGALSVLFAVADSGVFLSMVPGRRYVAGNSLLYGSRALARVSGPSLGGALVQALSAPVALLTDAVSYLASACFLMRIRPAEPVAQPGGLLMEGVRFIGRSAVMRVVLGATATVNFFTYMFVALFVFYATTALRVAPGALGVVLGAGAVGGVLGAMIAGRLAARIGVGRAFSLACVLFPAPLLLVPAAGGGRPLVLASLFLAEFGSGAGVMILDITAGSIFADVIPAALQARVTGAYRAVNFGVRPLGSLAAGALATAIGTHATLWVATAGALTCAFWLLPSPLTRRVRPPSVRSP